MKHLAHKALLPMLLSLLFAGCAIGIGHFNGIQPVSPKPPMSFARGTDALGRYTDPSGVPMVDGLQPTFVWKAAGSEGTKYDLSICVGVGKRVNPVMTVVAFSPGKQVYYREGIEGFSHHVEDDLAINTLYVWSVRTRNGSNVGPWSTYDFHTFGASPGFSTTEAGKDLWWPFKTPKGKAGVADGATLSSLFAPASSSQGRIFFFREKRFVGSGMETPIRVNGEVVGNAMTGGYFYVDRPPGTYLIACDKRRKDEKNEISITLNAGETKYIRTSFKDWQVFPAIEDPGIATKALSGCSYMPTIYQ